MGPVTCACQRSWDEERLLLSDETRRRTWRKALTLGAGRTYPLSKRLAVDGDRFEASMCFRAALHGLPAAARAVPCAHARAARRAPTERA